MDLDSHSLVNSLRVLYCQSYRCWKSNNFKTSLILCDNISNLVKRHKQKEAPTLELNQINQLAWFLKIKCLAEDYYISESLLLNEDDIEDQEQVRVFSAKTRKTQVSTPIQGRSTATIDSTGRKLTTGGVETRHKTGILTGRMPSASSRQSSLGVAVSSYRPLTTSLTATQTAFSRSTRPLLKYSTSHLLSKPLFEYLYNTQNVNNKCPDYRQCLEYLNMLQSSKRHHRKGKIVSKNQLKSESDLQMSKLAATANYLDNSHEHKLLDVFWLVSFGTCYFNLRMNKQAEEYFLKAIANNPKHLDSYTWLVKVYLRSNQLTKVLKICEEGLKQSRNCILYNWCARVYSLMGNLYMANLKLTDSLNYYPTNIEALANVGYFAFYGNKLEQSLRCFVRIQQLSLIQHMSSIESTNEFASGNQSQLLNNLALCNFYCGFYHKVVPLFLRSFLSSPSKDVTSDIWYNLSFLPMSCGFTQLAIACLRLSLKNNSQNKEALNNLGVLKYGRLINQNELHYKNRQEFWGTNGCFTSSSSNFAHQESGLKNVTDDMEQYQTSYNVAETYFSSVSSDGIEADAQFSLAIPPEALYNMAIVKRKRGQLLSSMKYCNLYLEHDSSNYHILNLINEIKKLVSHDGF